MKDSSSLQVTSRSLTSCFSFQPGSAIRVIVYPDTNSFPSGRYIVDGGGNVDFPIIGTVNILQFSPDSLEGFLQNAYLDYLNYPNISVRPLIHLTFIGGFRSPGLYYIDPRWTLWDAVRETGAMLRTDALKKMHWQRNRKIISKDITPFYESRKSLCQLGFESGDQITLTEKPKKNGWEIFQTDILPMVTFSITAATASITLYEFYKQWRYPK